MSVTNHKLPDECEDVGWGNIHTGHEINRPIVTIPSRACKSRDRGEKEVLAAQSMVRLLEVDPPT